MQIPTTICLRNPWTFENKSTDNLISGAFQSGYDD